MLKVFNILKNYIALNLKSNRVLFPSSVLNNILLGKVFIGRFCTINNCIIGSYSYFGNRCYFTNAKIGSFCSIAKGVQMVVGNHPSSIYVSTSPLFYAKNTCFNDTFNYVHSFNEYKTSPEGYSIEIGNDVWIGTNALLMEGIKIGDGAIIAAGSCVTKNVPSYAIVGGVPAKVIRYRFPDNELEVVKSIKWWEWDIERIKSNAKLFSNIKNFY